MDAESPLLEVVRRPGKRGALDPHLADSRSFRHPVLIGPRLDRQACAGRRRRRGDLPPPPGVQRAAGLGSANRHAWRRATARRSGCRDRRPGRPARQGDQRRRPVGPGARRLIISSIPVAIERSPLKLFGLAKQRGDDVRPTELDDELRCAIRRPARRPDLLSSAARRSAVAATPMLRGGACPNPPSRALRHVLVLSGDQCRGVPDSSVGLGL